MATTTTILKMKLLIDTKAKRVLFAEADKDVVDFLFSLLALPVATIVKMLGGESMCGSVGNLYASVENLDYNYVLPSVTKQALLQPRVVPSAASTSRSPLFLPAPSRPGQTKKFFKCSYNYYTHCMDYVTNSSDVSCPSCGYKMSRALKYVVPAADGSGQNLQKTYSGAAKGFVQGVVTYTVRDNLTVTPMSSISSITLLNTLGVTDFSALQEKTVLLGYSQGLQILKASLQSKTVLTDVFLGKKQAY